MASLLRECLHENGEYIEHIDKKLESITPYSNFTSELVQHLISREIIIPHLNGDLDQLIEEDDGSITYDIHYIKYRINIEAKDEDHQMLLHRLMYPRSTEFLGNSNFCYEFWKKLHFMKVCNI